ncbi:MAG: LLM class flavin-dependent oxidoreductase [Betaproteobacteria bacterium]|nr:LLM class flavin-dependent oxidoreductase [Betaproteobacteria bacterium]
MKFGLFGGAKVQRGASTADSHGYRTFIDYVKTAEALGYESLFMVEHHFTGQGQVSASLNMLSYLAACTTRMRLGTAVVVLPWHNPVLIAEQVATLDVLSGGRVDFGVGKGYRDNEFDGFCIPIEEATERFDEAIEVIRKAWTSTGRFSHQGKRWRFHEVVVEPEPVQRPHPPFWMGAGSADSIRRAARDGYSLLLDQVADIDEVIEKVRIYREACLAAGRPYSPMQVGLTRALHIVRTEEERAKALATRKEVLKTISSIARPLKPKTPGSYADPNIAGDDAALLGTPAEIIAKLRRLQAGGVEYILLVGYGDLNRSLREFAEEIMPHVQDSADVQRVQHTVEQMRTAVG